MPPTEAVAAALDRLGRLHPKKIDLSLGRMHRILAALDHPERRLPPVVHIAGTNGKGSTVAFTRAIAEAAGLTVHTYTSPHLVRFHERITLAGREIDDDRLVDVLDRCEAANGDLPITFFEVTTAAAFLAMAESAADLAVLEVGLGGRLDATNVIDRPLATAVTRIGHDHHEFLGDSIAGIAREKAGIFKPGVPAVIGPQADPEVIGTLLAAADATGATALLHGRDWTVDNGVVRAPGLDVALPDLPLPGRHQADNAAIATVIATRLGPLGTRPHRIDGDDIVAGLAQARWPARLQRLTRGPLVDALPADAELWLDGGHNPDAAEALASWLAAAPGRPTWLVLGMMGNKDRVGYLAPLAAHVDRLWAVDIPGAAAARPGDIVAAATALGMRAAGADSVATCLDAADLPPGARVVIAGSLYLAGHVLADNG